MNKMCASFSLKSPCFNISDFSNRFKIVIPWNKITFCKVKICYNFVPLNNNHVIIEVKFIKLKLN